MDSVILFKWVYIKVIFVFYKFLEIFKFNEIVNFVYFIK